MYNSPIEIITTEIIQQINKQTEEEVYKAVQKIGININKNELRKALIYDRDQYDKGYADGFEAGMKRAEELLEMTFNPNVILKQRSDNNAE